MVNSKFIRLYQSITEGERRLLKKWIFSPIHNQHKDIQKLFEYLFTRESLTSVTLKKERAFSYIFGEECYDMYKLNHLISYAYNTLEDFIEYLEAVKDDEKIKKNKIVAYHKRNLPKLAKQSLEKAIQQLSTKQYQNASFYYNAYQLEELRFEIEGPQQRNKDNNLPQLFQHVSDFFAITTLRYACIAATHSNVFNTAYDIPMMEAIINQIKIGKAAPVAVLYYYAYMALSKSEEEHYYTSLKEHFEKYGNLLPNKERRDILLITINYAIKRSHTGQLFYIQESLDLYKLGLETQLLLEDGELSRFAYKNIVALGLKLEDYDWTKYFITTYSPFLPIEVRQNYQDYVTAKYWFAKQNYGECMNLLIQIKYDDLFMNIDSKMMLLKIYYEQQSVDALDALTQSFTRFLNRKEVMSYHKTNYLNIIRLTKKMLHTPTFDEEGKQKLQQEILDTSPLTEKEWLLLQVNKL